MSLVVLTNSWGGGDGALGSNNERPLIFLAHLPGKGEESERWRMM